MAGDGHAARVATLPDFVFVVCARIGRYWTNPERRPDEFSRFDFLGEANEGVNQKAFRLASSKLMSTFLAEQ